MFLAVIGVGAFQKLKARHIRFAWFTPPAGDSRAEPAVLTVRQVQQDIQSQKNHRQRNTIRLSRVTTVTPPCWRNDNTRKDIKKKCPEEMFNKWLHRKEKTRWVLQPRSAVTRPTWRPVPPNTLWKALYSSQWAASWVNAQTRWCFTSDFSFLKEKRPEPSSLQTRFHTLSHLISCHDHDLYVAPLAESSWSPLS